MSRIVGSAEVVVGPSLKGFAAKAHRDLKKERISHQIPVHPELKRANAELAAWRKRQEANAVEIPVHLDERQFRRSMRRVEQTFKASTLSRAIRVNVAVAGAAALPLLARGAMSATAALTELGQAALVLPGILSGLGASIGTLLVGTGGLSKAFEAAGDGAKKASENAQKYERASRDLERAQRDVVSAMKDATREIQDQRDKLTQGALSVERAQLNVVKANERLAKGGFQTYSDYRDAVLDVKQANFDLSQSIKQNNRDIQDYYDNAGKSARQTDKVQDSLDKLSNAAEKFSNAQIEASGKTKDFLDAMAALSPAGRDFVTQLLSLEGAWKSLRGAVQDNLLKDLGNDIKALADRQLPRLRDGMVLTAKGLNTQFKAALSSLDDPGNTKSISRFFRNLSSSMNLSAPGIKSFISGFLHLSEVGSRFMPRLASAFNDVMARFDEFVKRTDADGSLERWIDRGLKLVASLGRSLGHIGSILNSITEAYEKATGRVGGLANSLEGGLSRLSDYLSSAAGQGAMVSYIKRATEFLDIIKEAMPGILDGFKAFAEAARYFATKVFPIYAAIGQKLFEHLSLVKLIIGAWMSWRTIAPIWSGLSKLVGRFNAGLQTQRERMADINSLQEKRSRLLEGSRAESRRYHAELSSLENNYRKELHASNTDIAGRKAMLTELHRQAKIASKGVQGSYAQLTASQARAAKAAEALDHARLNSVAAMQVYGQLSPQHYGALELETKAREKLNRATENQVRWQSVHNEALGRGKVLAKAVEDQEAGMAQAVSRRAKLQADATDLRSAAWARHTTAVSKSATQVDRIGTALDKLTGGQGKFGRLRAAIGGSGGGMIGSLGMLSAALGTVTSTIGSVVIAATLAYGLNELANAHDRAAWAADEHRRMEQALATTLNEATGAATNATTKASVQALQHHANPGHKDQFFDATDYLQRQLGLSTAQTGQLALPTMVKQREAAFAEGDAKVAAAVPQLPEWKRWGNLYKQAGVDEHTYGKALSGDQESIQKVERARDDIKRSANNPLLANGPMGAAVAAKAAPNDLGHAIDQLPTGLQELAKGMGAVRDVGNANVSAGQSAQKAAGAFPVTLNQRGMQAFAGYGIAPNGVASSDGESVDIAVDRAPSDAWVESVREKGITVTPRQPSGAIIHVDSSAVKNYAAFTKIPGLAGGGQVQGPGGPTADKIPAMLSDGEFVMRAKAVDKYGAGLLHSMNALNFAGGGLAKLPLAPTPVNPFLPPPPAPPQVPFTWGPAPQPVPPIQMPSFTDLSTGEGLPKRLPKKGPSILDMLPPGLRQQQGPSDLDILMGRGGTDVDPSVARPGSAGSSLKMPPGVGFQGSLDLLKRSLAEPPAPPSAPAKPSPAPSASGGTPAAAPGGMPTLHHRNGAVLPGPRAGVGATVGGVRIPSYEELGTGYTGAPGEGPEMGLQPNAINVRRAVQAQFPQLTHIGGWRKPDGFNEHSSGQAIDIMIPGWDTPEGKALGDQVSQWVLAHASELGVDYTIWQHGQHDPDGTFTMYPDRGSDNDNHMNHVHVHVAAGAPASGGVGQFPGIDLGGGVPGIGGIPGLGSGQLRTTNLGARAVGGMKGSGQSILNVEGGIPGLTAMPMGPFGPIPFTAMDFGNKLGAAFLQLIGGFFGIDLTQITGLVNQIIGGIPRGQGGFDEGAVEDYGYAGDPGPDPLIIQELVAQAAEEKANGNEATARSLLQAARDYGARAATQSIDMPSLDGGAGKTEIASRIIAEAQRRGYTPDQTIAILSTAMQESGLDPAIAGGGGAWHGIFQQDSSYPGRDDPAQNIGAFFDRLEGKGGPQSPDIWKSIFWLQQRPGEASADIAFANGRQNYLSEIQSQMGPATSMYQSIVGALGGFAGGGKVAGPGGPTADKIPAMLSDGEFVMRAKAVDKYGPGLLNRMNSLAIPHLAGGGFPFNVLDPVKNAPPPGPLPAEQAPTAGAAPAVPGTPQAPEQPGAAPPPAQDIGAPPAGGAPVGAPAGAGPQPLGPQAGQPGSSEEGSPNVSDVLGGVGAGANGASASQPGAAPAPGANNKQDPRGILGAAPKDQNHNNPALDQGIKGAFQYAGSMAAQAASMAIAAGSMGAGAAGGSQAVGSAIQGGSQIAGQAVTGAMNVLSSLLVGTLTPGTTGQGYGAPLLPQQPGQSPVRQFQSVHNGDVVTNNLDDYMRTKDRMEAQRALPYLNRV